MASAICIHGEYRSHCRQCASYRSADDLHEKLGQEHEMLVTTQQQLAAAVDLLRRWRARGFPMGSAPLWDDTKTFLENFQSSEPA